MRDGFVDGVVVEWLYTFVISGLSVRLADGKALRDVGAMVEGIYIMK